MTSESWKLVKLCWAMTQQGRKALQHRTATVRLQSNIENKPVKKSASFNKSE